MHENYRTPHKILHLNAQRNLMISQLEEIKETVVPDDLIVQITALRFKKGQPFIYSKTPRARTKHGTPGFQLGTFLLLSLLLLFVFAVNFLIVVQVQLSLFSPHHSPQSHSSPPPTLKPIPFGFVHVSFIHAPWWTFPCFSPLSLSVHPFGYYQFVLYFNVSGYILHAYFLLLIRSHL